MTPPKIGAKIGAAPLTRASNAINCVNCLPEYISRADARAITIPAAPVNPCTNRKNTNNQIFGLNAHKTDEIPYKINVNVNGLRRPCTSLNGPKTSCPAPKPIKQVVILNCASEAVVCISFATSGKAGKYMSIDNGPKAVNDPKINTISHLLCTDDVSVSNERSPIFIEINDHPSPL